MTWYTRSMTFIKEQKLKHPNMPHAELRRHCSKNYPFGDKSGWAYKAWLNAMRDEFGRARRYPAPAKAGQTDFLYSRETTR